LKTFRVIYQLSFYLLSIVVFVIGGLSQFLFGISNTIMTFFLMVSLLAVYFIYSLLKARIVFNRFVFIALLYLLVIVLSAVLNKSDIVSTLVYFIFPFLPLSVYLFTHINFREQFLTFEKVFKLFFYIGLIQLPILLIQRNLYDFLIRFNKSGQTIESLDFMFGSFFIKSDHSLGVFLLLLIASILYHRKRIAHIVLMPRIALVYLLISIFLTESNISKLIAVILVATTIILPIYHKYGERLFFRLGVLILIVTMGIAGFSLKDKPIIQNRLGGPLAEQLSIESAEKFYEERTAKRFQIVLVAAQRLSLKWIGDGPYSYFEIRSGKFTKAPHFSQLLWTYFDLGLLGLTVVISYLWVITGFLSLKRGIVTLFLFGILMVYSFYTTFFSDIAMLFSLFFILARKVGERNSTLSLPRSEG